MSRTESERQVRELDRRTNDGLEVRLLWNPSTNQVSVAVIDNRFGGSFEHPVAGSEALLAFHHPYAHARHNHQADALRS